MKMEAVYASEILLNIFQIAGCCNPEQLRTTFIALRSERGSFEAQTVL
jgi:hypothetical protein